MDIQATKLKLLKTILENENAEFIQKVADFVQKEEADFWNDLTPEQQKEIQDASAEIEQGKTTDYETFMYKHT